MMNQLLMSVLSQRKGAPVSIENYVRFVSAEARTITPKYTNSGVTLEYSVDRGKTWTTITSESATTSAKEHWFRGQATGTKRLFTSIDSSNTWTFSGSSDLEVYGNLNFLLCDTLGDEEAPTTLGDYAYNNMFYGCTSLTTAPKLPATTLAQYCYAYMFYGCTSLTTAPKLPATILASSCYDRMFYNCTLLTTAPELPATTLAGRCYNYMFYGCTSLTTAPELPATILANSCYMSMFSGCTSLTTAPELPATTLIDWCYAYMFYNCTLLTTPPELPATTLRNYCYYSMFKDCTSFKVSATKTGSYTYAWRIPTSGYGSAATSWNTDMLSSTGGTFTSDPSINTTYWVVNKPIEPIKYTVTFVDYDGTILDTQIVYYGGSAIAPTEPSRVGYIFNGWDIDFTNVTSDLTVTATYFAEPKIYDLLNDVIDTNALNQGDIINCDYSGTSQNITLPAGSYQLEVWGGQGEQLGGLGGYTKGTLNLINTKTLYLFVGGSGSNRWLNGGFITVGNNGADCSYIGTHALSLYSMFIVAGGGGGGTRPSENRKGGYGGGLAGGVGDSGSYSGGRGGMQQTGGSSAETNGSGVWGAAQNLKYGNGGGGGWYGGGAAKVGSPTGGGGGGSGYVFTETSVKSTYYDDYLDSSFYLVDTLMLAGNQEMPSKSGIGTTIGNAYNGYIRITVL